MTRGKKVAILFVTGVAALAGGIQGGRYLSSKQSKPPEATRLDRSLPAQPKASPMPPPPVVRVPQPPAKTRVPTPTRVAAKKTAPRKTATKPAVQTAATRPAPAQKVTPDEPCLCDKAEDVQADLLDLERRVQELRLRLTPPPKEKKRGFWGKLSNAVTFPLRVVAKPFQNKR